MAEIMAMPASDEPSYYAILNLPRDASDEDVRRAYRNLAQVFHPDKHTGEELRGQAKEAFAKLQEAYEVLSDPATRQIYDVYGREGLVAGFTLGTKLDGIEELRKKWEQFKKQQEQERQEHATTHRGSYMCRIDVTELPKFLEGKAMLFKSVVVQNSLEVAVGEQDVVWVQGQAALRNAAGAGSLIFGYKRVLSAHDSLDASVVLGLRCALSLTSTRQISAHSTASVTAGYTLGSGMSLSLATTRQLPYGMSATLGWVVGPSGADGVSLNIVKRGTKYATSGKLELGAVTALSARASYNATESVTVRCIARAGTTGVDLELGANTKFSDNTSGYMAAVLGVGGVAVKLRLVRAGQTFEVPITLSHHSDDFRALALAYLGPPLLYIGMSRYVVRPFLRWQRARKERAHQEQRVGEITAALSRAATESSLLEPVARRRARSEAAKLAAGGGLVVLDAAYGRLEAYLGEGGPQQRDIAAALAAEHAAAQQQPEQTQQQEQSDVGSSAASNGGEPGAAAAASSASGTSGSTAAAAAARAAPPDAPTPSASRGQAAAAAAATALPRYVRVTAALQYLVSSNDSSLLLHPGASKVGLMGFADPVPGSLEPRQLYVAYQHGHEVYEVTVDDTGALALPGAGQMVTVAARVHDLRALGAAALGWGPHAAA